MQEAGLCGRYGVEMPDLIIKTILFLVDGGQRSTPWQVLAQSEGKVQEDDNQEHQELWAE